MPSFALQFHRIPFVIVERVNEGLRQGVFARSLVLIRQFHLDVEFPDINPFVDHPKG
jgi:hypothetical protein